MCPTFEIDLPSQSTSPKKIFKLSVSSGAIRNNKTQTVFNENLGKELQTNISKEELEIRISKLKKTKETHKDDQKKNKRNENTFYGQNDEKGSENINY